MYLNADNLQCIPGSFSPLAPGADWEQGQECAALGPGEGSGHQVRHDILNNSHLLSCMPHFISSGHKCVLMSENWSTPQMWGPCSWTTKYWWPQTSSRIFTSGTWSPPVTAPPLATPATRGSETPASDHSQVCHCLSNGSFIIYQSQVTMDRFTVFTAREASSWAAILLGLLLKKISGPVLSRVQVNQQRDFLGSIDVQVYLSVLLKWGT